MCLQVRVTSGGTPDKPPLELMAKFLPSRLEQQPNVEEILRPPANTLRRKCLDHRAPAPSAPPRHNAPSGSGEAFAN